MTSALLAYTEKDPSRRLVDVLGTSVVMASVHDRRNVVLTHRQLDHHLVLGLGLTLEPHTVRRRADDVEAGPLVHPDGGGVSGDNPQVNQLDASTAAPVDGPADHGRTDALVTNFGRHPHAPEPGAVLAAWPAAVGDEEESDGLIVQLGQEHEVAPGGAGLY